MIMNELNELLDGYSDYSVRMVLSCPLAKICSEEKPGE